MSAEGERVGERRREGKREGERGKEGEREGERGRGRKDPENHHCPLLASPLSGYLCLDYMLFIQHTLSK